MPRRARFAPPGLFLHITQRGNYRQRTFFTDDDRRFYLQLLEHNAAEQNITIAGHCLMSNHIHLLASAAHEGAISAFMKNVNGEYSRVLHARLSRRGRLWQGRFYSCVLEEWSMTSVLRYIERNPVRASMVANAEDYRWSSAAAHLGQSRYPAFLDQAAFVDRWTVNEWRELLRARQAKGEVQQIRSATRQGRPLGSDEFLDDLSKHWNLELPRVTPNYAVRQPPQRITTFREAALLSAN